MQIIQFGQRFWRQVVRGHFVDDAIVCPNAPVPLDFFTQEIVDQLHRVVLVLAALGHDEAERRRNDAIVYELHVEALFLRCLDPGTVGVGEINLLRLEQGNIETADLWKVQTREMRA